MCRSLERQGYRVLRAHPMDVPDGRSYSCVRPLRYPSATDAPDAFLGFVARACRERRVDVVLPLDESVVRLLAESGANLGSAVVAGPNALQYHALCNKAELIHTARVAGVDHPHTVEVTGEVSTGEWPDLPCIVKPGITAGSGRTEAAVLVTTIAERDAAVRALVNAGVSALVQERLTGQRWVGHCVLSEHGFDFLGFRVDRDYPRYSGPASVMHTASVPPQVIDATRRLLEHVRYRGPCGLSFIERNGRFLVHDVNLRLGATVEVSIRSGFDIPGRSVEAALGRPSPPLRVLTPTRYVRFDSELREFVRALHRRETGEPASVIARWIASGLTSRQTVLDPSPFDSVWMLGVLSRRAKRLGSSLGARLR